MWFTTQADMLFYAFSTILKFAALVQLRFTEPDAFRPYRIPMETYPLAGMLSSLDREFSPTLDF